MKYKATNFILLLLITSAFVKAQNDETNFRFGIHASPNISWLSTTDPDVEKSSSLKFGFGLISEYYFARNYAFSGGIDVVSRGATMTASESDGTLREGDYKATYIQIPVKLKMRSRQFGYFRGFAEFGGGIGIEVSERVKFNPEIPDEFREPSYVSPVNFLFTVGAGTEYDLGGQTSIMAGIYYNRSLIDNIDNDYSAIRDKYTYRFDYVNLRIGFLF